MRKGRFTFKKFLKHLRIKQLPIEKEWGHLREYTPMHDSLEFLANGGRIGWRDQPGMTRREFLKKSAMVGTAAGVLLGGVPLVSVIDVANAQVRRVKPFRYALIADTHLQITWPPENHTTQRFVETMERAVAEINALDPQPDFVLFMGDLAHLGRREELELGKQILSKLKVKKVLQINGEHDWYYDMGAAYEQMFGKMPWSMDVNGVQFLAMNSVITKDYWTDRGWGPQERMGEMTKLDSKIIGLWGVPEDQVAWLRNELARIPKDKPIVVLTHTPLWMYYPSWGFATRTGPEILELLKRFDNVTCLHGHVHQIVYKEIGHIRSIGMLSTSWPWPYPVGAVPPETKMFERVDPGDPFDGVGWSKGFLDLVVGGTQYTLYNHYVMFGRPEEMYPGGHPTKRYETARLA